MKPYNAYLMEHYLRRASKATTVSESLAKAYKDNFGVQMTVIMNAPSFQDLEPSPIENEVIRLVHHGNAVRRRMLDQLIEMMAQLDDRFTLDFILKPSDSRYYGELKQLARKNSRVTFLQPVPPDSISGTRQRTS